MIPGLDSRDGEVLLMVGSCSISHRDSDWSLALPDIKILKGSVTLLTGSNMSGKSSLLRFLANQQVACPRSFQSQFRSVFAILSAADDPMFRGWSVSDNIFVTLPVISRALALARLIHFFGRVKQDSGLEILHCNPLYSYSTGARAFVQLARAAVAKPELYLVDEITPNLDDNKLSLFLKVLAELQNDGVALVFVSHSPRDQIEIKKIFNCLVAVEIVEDEKGGFVLNV